MKNVKKGFTLVELIVVITILAILGTIAFISLQGYSADARNSKRTSDLNNLAGKMNILSTEGIALLSFVNGTTGRLTGISISWSWVTDGTDYEASIPNYLVLWVKTSDYKDPNGLEYQIGLTTKKAWEYELAAVMERWTGEKEAKVVGTYSPRGTGAITPISGMDTTTIKLGDGDLNKFRKGDYIITDLGSWSIINAISPDFSLLTLNVAGTGTTIALANPESAGLIGSVASWSVAVTNGSTTDLPYGFPY